ncbi:NRPS-like enzyme [Guyanagaster necrorhizus]|uniref:NRPS-like enzyme n=1 Tax=Guyanagaster necrorhizus TaxID=856835 RepID=A0A9P7VN99_9AGAR|nr:NRPS-like enzyme [Guyanagaster necrorhizus MCA 3950]KAG7443762.1 NRPS-like enzyme [Guyanagaster necrorhizus MCA 3950]
MSLPTPQGVSSPTFKAPPLDGSLTFPELFDYNAIHSAKHTLFRYDDLANGGFRTISWEEGVAAIHTAGHYFKKFIQREAPVSIAILANTNSITYAMVITGLMRLGFIPFPISPRNSAAAVAHLIKSTDSKHLIVSQDPSLQKVADTVCHQFWETEGGDKITTIPMPCFSDLFSTKPGTCEPLPPVHPDWSQTAFIMHSSGTTRFPGPIYATHKHLLQHAVRPYYGDVDLCGQVFGSQSAPMYHAMGFVSITDSTATGSIMACFPPVEPPVIPTAERILSSIINTGTTIVATIPSFLVEWAHNRQAVEVLKATAAVAYGSGPLEKEAGDTLVANGILLLTVYGLTESSVSMLWANSIPVEGWEWMKVARNVDVAFVPTDEQDIYRLYVKDGPLHSPAVLDTEIDGVKAFDTKDLVQLHPSNRKLFKVYGRADEQIMHSTGVSLCTNPVPIEAGLVLDKRIAAAMMFGRAKFQPGVLILPTPEEAFDPNDTTRLAEYRTSIWDTITKVNEQAPQHSRIYKEMIIVANPAKPFEFTVKGSLRRKAVLKAYEQEIESLYKTVDEASETDIVIPQLWTLKNVVTIVRDIVTAVFQRNIGDTDNIFLAGGDSLTATSIRNSLLRAIRKSKVVPVAVIRALPHNFVFDLPSIAAMSAFVHGIMVGARASLGATRNDEADEEGYPEIDSVPDLGQSLVKLRERGGEPPLIMLHGAGGLYFEYVFFAEKFRTAVWTMTVTPDTPLNSLHEMAAFYFAKIKSERPIGPYRLASYSASSVLLVVLTKLFEDNGDEVVQAVILDHFPAMFMYSANKFGNPDPRVAENIKMMLNAGMSAIGGMMDRDTHGSALRRSKNLLLDAWNGGPANEISRRSVGTIKAYLTAIAEFVYDLFTDETGAASMELMAQWMRTVKAPITVVVAADGAVRSVADEDREMWADLGAKRCLPDAQVVFVKGGHYEFLTDDSVIRLLQEGC